jgi:hypothetical protein
MAQLELTRSEGQTLRAAVDVRLHELRTELAGADLRRFKAELRAELDRLESVARRLDAALADAATPAAKTPA